MSARIAQIVTHQFSTIVNPEGLTLEELRAHVKRMGNELFEKDCQIVQQKEWLSTLHRVLATVCELRLTNRVRELNEEIERLAAHYKASHIDANAERKVH